MSIITRTIPKARHICLFVCLMGLGGCANSIPIFSEMMPDDGPKTTGSIFSPSTSLSTELTASDWKKANEALDSTLKPENASLSAEWDNPATGTHGTFKPVGEAVVRDGDFCRSFSAQITVKNSVKPPMQGTACRTAAGEWQIADVNSTLGQH